MRYMKGLALGIGALLMLTMAACQASAPVAAHPQAADKPEKPKRLEVIQEIHMYDNYFASADGQQNPTFKLPAGKTVGIHIHNEGKILHELAIGRKVQWEETEVSGKKVPVPGGYETNLLETIPSDLFFYYGGARAELEDAKFGELEIDAGIRDVWIRMKIPANAKGTWELGCFVPGHYEAGMKTTLIVE